MVTSLFDWVKSSLFVSLTRRLLRWGEDWEVLRSSQFHLATPVWIQCLLNISGLLKPTSLCFAWNTIPKYIRLFDFQKKERIRLLHIWQVIKPEGKIPANRLKQTKHDVWANCLSRQMCPHTQPPPHARVYYFVWATLSFLPSRIALSQARACPPFSVFKTLPFCRSLSVCFDVKNLPHFSLWLAVCTCVWPALRSPRYIPLL